MSSDQSGDGGYRIECLDCGAWAIGDPDDDPEHDKQYHRDHHCEGAEFEVTEGGY